MNLFILDYDLDKNAQYHIDKHVGKMQLEAGQLLAIALWVDKIIGYCPRKLNKEESDEVQAVMAKEPHIDERKFVRYLAPRSHTNHPCAIWVRSSLDNFEWAQVYVNALNEETMYRGNKSHASCAEVNKWPSPTRLPRVGLTPFALSMPEDYKQEDAVEAYRTYYRNYKAEIASWKTRGEPNWW